MDTVDGVFDLFIIPVVYVIYMQFLLVFTDGVLLLSLVVLLVF